MSNPLPARETSADEESLLQLWRSLEWEATGQLPGRRLLIGALIQAVLMSPWLVSLPRAVENSPPTRYDDAVPLFEPPRSSAVSPLPLAPVPSIVPRDISLEPPVPAVSELTVDLASIILSFADDMTGQLPEVVRRNGGALALLDKEDQEDRTIARYILEPPSWEAHEVIRDVSWKFLLGMDPPQKWEVFRTVAERYGIDLDRYRACAMFDAAYGRCLQDAIRSRALSGASHSAGRVSSATLAFSIDRPCGIEVLEVSIATDAPH
jgi:hypothetical protein